MSDPIKLYPKCPCCQDMALRVIDAEAELAEVKEPAQRFMAFVTWDNFRGEKDVPGYPLSPDVGNALRNLRDALKGGKPCDTEYSGLWF